MNAPLGLDVHDHVIRTGAFINVPAVLIIAAMTVLLYVGMRGSAGANTFMVTVKVAIIVIIVIAGLKYVDAVELEAVYTAQHRGSAVTSALAA